MKPGSTPAGALHTVRYQRDLDGVVQLTLDDPHSPVNTVNAAYKASMRRAIDRLEAEQDQVTGVIITSAKSTFFAGGDLKSFSPSGLPSYDTVFAHVEEVKALSRRIETYGRPVVAALNGSALGGGFELALACHHRICVTTAGVEIGLPEVGIGLIPGGGGIIRVVRMLGVQSALQDVVLPAGRFSPAQARSLGLIDDLVDQPDDLLHRARVWLASHRQQPMGTVKQPWDRPGFTAPGGHLDWPTAAAALGSDAASFKPEHGGLANPAVSAAIAAAVEAGGQVSFDEASRIESTLLASTASGPTSANMIGVRFLDRSVARKAWARSSSITTVGVRGHGETARQIMERCVTTDFKVHQIHEPHHVSGCDIVFDASGDCADNFDSSLRAATEIGIPYCVIDESRYVNEAVAAGALGLHRMPFRTASQVVELFGDDPRSNEFVACGTFLASIGMLPVAIRPSPGLLLTRIAAARVREALVMLGEGTSPVVIERTARNSGYAITPLSLADRIGVDIDGQLSGESVDDNAARTVAFMRDAGRIGGREKAGFYAPAEGTQTSRLWPGLGELPHNQSPVANVEQIRDRLLALETLEFLRCLGEEIVLCPPAANMAAVEATGFPITLGGPLRYAVQDRGEAFRALCARLTQQNGPRFTLDASATAGLRLILLGSPRND